jgi:hypothetical protein
VQTQAHNGKAWQPGTGAWLRTASAASGLLLVFFLLLHLAGVALAPLAPQRFEAYAAGVELCNAFEELTDPVEQRSRFEKDMELREQVYGKDFPRTPLDEDFLEALEEGLPPSGGNALGIDRLVMLLGDEPDIRYTFWLEAYAGPGDAPDTTRS